MDSYIAVVAAILSVVAIFVAGFAIVTRSNKYIREEIEEKQLDSETQCLADEAWELEQDILD